MTTMCKLGNAPVTSGSTPTSIAGATIVSPQQAKCLIDNFSSALLVIGAMPDLQQLPDAWPLPVLGTSTADADFEKYVASDFVPLTGGRKDRPILIYCHHASCQYSANGSEHLVRMGYQRVFWLRDGTKGWAQAGYAFEAKPRIAPRHSAAAIYFKAAGNHTYGCFGESSASACESKIWYEQQALNAPDLKPAEIPVVLDALLNTIAAYASDLRTGGVSPYFPTPRFEKNPKRALELITPAMAMLREAQTKGLHSEAVASNQKLIAQAAMLYADSGRWSDFDAALKLARDSADQSYSGIEAGRSDEKKLKSAQSRIIGAEQFERTIATTFGEQAIEAYKAGKTVDGARLAKIAHASYARLADWIVRSGDEGISGFAEQAPQHRMVDMNLEQAGLYLAAGDKNAAAASYQSANAFSCPFVKKETWDLVDAGKPIADRDQFSFANGCERAEFGAMKASGELDRLILQASEAQVREQYRMLGLDYDALVKKGQSKK